MSFTKIATIFADSEQLGGKEVTVGGWARTIRDMKNFGFVELNDGTFFRNLQIILEADRLPASLFINMAGTTGLEPAISGVTGQRDNQLRYTHLMFSILHKIIFCVNTFNVEKLKNYAK